MLEQHMQDTYQYLFDEAHRALTLGGSFRPFGAGIRKTGEQIQTLVDPPAEKNGPQDHIAGLIAGFREDDRQNGLMAAGLVFDGQMTEGGDAYSRAIIFHLEAANGRAVEVVIGYEKRVGDVIDF
ncbi:MAG: hypothetical protein AB7T08_15510, partial [Hyphomonadaceae bacterium]